MGWMGRKHSALIVIFTSLTSRHHYKSGTNGRRQRMEEWESAVRKQQWECIKNLQVTDNAMPVSSTSRIITNGWTQGRINFLVGGRQKQPMDNGGVYMRLMRMEESKMTACPNDDNDHYTNNSKERTMSIPSFWDFYGVIGFSILEDALMRFILHANPNLITFHLYSFACIPWTMNPPSS